MKPFQFFVLTLIFLLSLTFQDSFAQEGATPSSTPTAPPSPTASPTPTSSPSPTPIPLLENTSAFMPLQCTEDGRPPSPSPTPSFTPLPSQEAAINCDGCACGCGGGGGGGGDYGDDILFAPVYDGLENPDGMFFQNYGVNPFVDTDDDNLSTFALDVDTASFTLARTYLTNYQQLPPPESIRPEEFINYFATDYTPPSDEADFAFALEASEAPFGHPGHYLLRLGIQGRVIDPQDRDPALLIFVIDVSGSMATGQRLEMVKQALYLLLEQLRPDDYVGIVIYTDTACSLQMPVSARDRSLLSQKIGLLAPQQTTNAEAGLVMGYDMAEAFHSDERQTRVILLSDGVANVDTTSPEGILERIQDQVDLGISLTSVGVGMGNYNDVLLEQLANQGDGNYYYVDNLREAQRVFVNNLTATLQLLARDAKVQVEFDPATVEHYRLIGYENRDIADEDFRNDSVDAGAIGVGHSITALYEVALNYNAIPSGAEVARVSLRYQQVSIGEIVEVSESIWVQDLQNPFETRSRTFQLQALAAEFAEILRGSYWARNGDIESVWGYVRLLPKQGDIQDFIQMVSKARP